MTLYSLTMKRGKRSVFIGLFPSLYRAQVVECNLEWCPCWKPVIEEKEVTYADSPDTTKPHQSRLD